MVDVCQYLKKKKKTSSARVSCTFYKRRQLALEILLWRHAVHNCVPVRIIHARYLSNSSITLTLKGHTRLFSRFRLVSNTIRPACVAPHVIETEKKNRTDYQAPTKKMRYFNEKSRGTVVTYIHTTYDIIYMSTSTLNLHAPQWLKVVQETTPHPCFASYHLRRVCTYHTSRIRYK